MSIETPSTQSFAKRVDYALVAKSQKLLAKCLVLSASVLIGRGCKSIERKECDWVYALSVISLAAYFREGSARSIDWLTSTGVANIGKTKPS